MGTVGNAVIEHVRAKQEESNQAWEDTHHYDEPRLFVSDIGHCPRAAYYNAFAHFEDHPFAVEKTHPFDEYVLEIMRAGTIWEHQTGLALRHALDGAVHWQKDDPALEVGNDIWLGHMDFLVDPCDHFPEGAIIEHKATNPVNFVRKDRLPYPFHCYQVLAYQELLRAVRADVPAFLYYRSWANWAELRVWDDTDAIVWEGEVNGKRRLGSLNASLDEGEYLSPHLVFCPLPPL